MFQTNIHIALSHFNLKDLHTKLTLILDSRSVWWQQLFGDFFNDTNH